MTFDEDRATNQAKRIGYEVAKATWGSGEERIDDGSLHPLIAGDPYADATTILS